MLSVVGVSVEEVLVELPPQARALKDKVVIKMANIIFFMLISLLSIYHLIGRFI